MKERPHSNLKFTTSSECEVFSGGLMETSPSRQMPKSGYGKSSSKKKHTVLILFESYLSLPNWYLWQNFVSESDSDVSTGVLGPERAKTHNGTNVVKFTASASISMSNINSSEWRSWIVTFETLALSQGEELKLLNFEKSRLKFAENSIWSSLSLGHVNYFRAGLWANWFKLDLWTSLSGKEKTWTE